MRLASKLILIVVVGIVILLIVDDYFSARRVIMLMETDMERDLERIGHTMGGVILDLWHSEGQARALRLIDDANRFEHPVKMRWVWLDVPPGDPSCPRLPRSYFASARPGATVSGKQYDDHGLGRLYTYVPLSPAGGRSGALELSEPLSDSRSFARGAIIKTGLLTAGLIGASVIAAVCLGFFLVGRPLQTLVEKTRRVSIGDLSEPVPIRGRDELCELAGALNTMCERLAEAQRQVREETESRIATLEQLRHADRLATVGRLASGVSHELGTPLNVISGRASMITSGELAPAEIKECAEIIRAQTQRVVAIIRHLLDFARRRRSNLAVVNLRHIVQETVVLMDTLATKRGVTLRLSSDDGEAQVWAKADAGQIQQVLSNLIINGIQAMPEGGAIELTLETAHAAPPPGVEATEGDYVRVVVKDEGEGIDEETLVHLFEPFFTTKDVGEGTGLGLSIAYGIVAEHGGWIDVSSTRGQGSRFSVYLPREETACDVAS